MEKTNPLVGTLKKQETLDEAFLKYINKPGLPYEKILLQKHKNRVFSVLKGENPPPYEIEIQPSATCNAQCKHCWGKDFIKLENKLYNLPAMERIINQTLDFNKNGFKIDIIKFCGSTGEPLLNPFTTYAINYIYGKRYLRLFTNGIKIGENKNNLKYLETIAKVDRINISLDAGSTDSLHETKPGSKHIQLEDILQGIRKIKEISNKTDMEIGYVITQDNYHEIIQAVRKLKKAKANVIKFRIDLTDREISRKHGKEINDMLDFSKIYEDENFKVIPVHSKEEVENTNQNYFSAKESICECLTCRLWTCIGPNGHGYGCGHIVAADTKSYGDLLNQEFPEMWESEKRIQIINALPIKKCNICSPSSIRTNKFGEFLSDLTIPEIKNLCETYLN